MAKNLAPIFLLIVMTWVMVVTTEGIQQSTSPIMTNRQSRHIFLFPRVTTENELPSIDFEYSPYNHPGMNEPEEGTFINERSEPRIPISRFNRPVTSPAVYYSGDSTSGVRGKTFAAFANLSRNLFSGRNGPLCPQCPQCPSFPAIPPCPNPIPCPAPASPSPPANGDMFIPATTGCTTTRNSLDATLAPCTRASAAPKGTIRVTFTATTTSVILGIAGATPTTVIKLTCTAFPTTFLGVTQFGLISPASPIINGLGFVQFLASSGGSVTSGSLTCEWSS